MKFSVKQNDLKFCNIEVGYFFDKNNMYIWIGYDLCELVGNVRLILYGRIDINCLFVSDHDEGIYTSIHLIPTTKKEKLLFESCYHKELSCNDRQTQIILIPVPEYHENIYKKAIEE